MRLECQRVYLRKLRKDDAPILLESTQDEELRYLTGTTQNFTLEQIESYIEKIDKDTTRYDFAICLKDTNEMIGELSVMDLDETNKKAGFRIAMCAINLTGKGYGTEAIETIKQFVFEQLNLNRLQLEVYSHNTRAISAYEKAGFVREGILRQSVWLRESYVDEIIMAILSSEYKKK